MFKMKRCINCGKLIAYEREVCLECLVEASKKDKNVIVKYKGGKNEKINN